MSGPVAAIGEPNRVQGFRLAGVRVFEAGDSAAAQEAWRRLAPGTSVIFLTRQAQAALAAQLAESERTIWAVLPS